MGRVAALEAEQAEIQEAAKAEAKRLQVIQLPGLASCSFTHGKHCLPCDRAAVALGEAAGRREDEKTRFVHFSM